MTIPALATVSSNSHKRGVSRNLETAQSIYAVVNSQKFISLKHPVLPEFLNKSHTQLSAWFLNDDSLKHHTYFRWPDKHRTDAVTGSARWAVKFPASPQPSPAPLLPSGTYTKKAKSLLLPPRWPRYGFCSQQVLKWTFTNLGSDFFMRSKS